MNFWKTIPSGNRKLLVLGPAMLLAIVAAITALFSGHMTAPECTQHVIEVLKWGGGIFAGANVAEHLAKQLMPPDKE